MAYSPTHELNLEEKDLVWKFRHHLTRDKRVCLVLPVITIVLLTFLQALTKFVKSVSWHDQGEARQAVQIIPKWTEIDVDEALELLGPNFDNPVVRAYAVDRLRKADDEVGDWLECRLCPAMLIVYLGAPSLPSAAGASAEVRKDLRRACYRCGSGLLPCSLFDIEGGKEFDAGKLFSLVPDGRM